MKTIAIMMAGNTSDTVQNKVGTKRQWYLKYLSHYNFHIKFLDIFDKGFSYDHIDDDAWIITGSECSVYDNLDWLHSFKILLSDAINDNIPILGICFGHQLLADVLEGDVQKNSNGWEIGYSSIQLTSKGLKSKLFSGFKQNFYAAETPQDVIFKLSDHCILLAQNTMGIQSFQYKDNIFGVQFHPEFDNKIMDTYIEMRKENGINISNSKVQDIEMSHIIFNNFIKLI